MIYVCSDIHGNYSKYNQIFRHVTDDDTLYVLGDCIDRYPDGIKVLDDIMERPNVELFIGNHEDMMYRVVFCKDEVQRKNWASVWCFPGNGGIYTLRALDKVINSNLDFKRYKLFLENCFVKKEITVGDKRFCLSHAGNFMPDSEELRYCEISLDDCEDYLWHGPLSEFSKYHFFYKREGCYDDSSLIHINGHTPVQYLRDRDSDEVGYFQRENVIGIDGGVATKQGYLILLRLDDMKQIIIR